MCKWYRLCFVCVYVCVLWLCEWNVSDVCVCMCAVCKLLMFGCRCGESNVAQRGAMFAVSVWLVPGLYIYSSDFTHQWWNETLDVMYLHGQRNTAQ